MRRFNVTPQRSAMMAAVPNSAVANAVRPFFTIYNIMASLLMMTTCIAISASWANNIMNLRKFGRWRFRNQIDEPIMVQDFRHARYVGGVVGFLFYWFWVGPRKYWTSDYGSIPGNKRFGPF